MKTGIKVGDAMTEQPIYVSPENSLEVCAREMEEHHVGAILVKGNDNLVGLLTEQDIVRNVIAKGKNPLDMKVAEVMETDLHTITPDKDIFEALDKMKELNIRHLPVVDDGQLMGLLTLKDVLKIEPQLFELLVEKFELREEENKPINRQSADEGVCNECGEYSDKLVESDGVMVCETCAKSQE
ncbi:MAG: CBS domain-containing protein [Nanoarchaeota archaeon]|nr:CBS domain-containing protein [Nanoarchaeota archaeon]